MRRKLIFWLVIQLFEKKLFYKYFCFYYVGLCFNKSLNVKAVDSDVLCSCINLFGTKQQLVLRHI